MDYFQQIFDTLISAFYKTKNIKKVSFSKINKVFVNYFLENDCRNLEGFVRNWETNPIFKGRMKIIRDCVNIIISKITKDKFKTV